MRAAWIPLLSLVFLLRATGAASEASKPPVLNGFTLSPASVPTSDILAGGPPRDGIPALTDPRSLPAHESPWQDDEIVVGVALGEQARAYPIAILNWHELVNDTLGGRRILVSYCPLCGTALVFDRDANGRARTFGVSGLLYQSDLLLYDRESESLWSQIAAKAITGPALGERLRVLRSSLLPWGDWKASHPDTEVLSLDTGHHRPYARDPYDGYSRGRVGAHGLGPGTSRAAGCEGRTARRESRSAGCQGRAAGCEGGAPGREVRSPDREGRAAGCEGGALGRERGAAACDGGAAACGKGSAGPQIDLGRS